MCDVTRREFMAGTVSLLGMIPAGELRAAPQEQTGKVENVSADVYFRQDEDGCNTGWVILEDYVLVIDANFPSGAKELLSRIRAVTDKPVRFAFDTHHHGDHVYGNQIFLQNGAVPLAHTGVLDELKKYETGYYGNSPGRWEQAAKGRADLKSSRLKPPSLLFPRELIFDDGKHRIELIHLGVAHTHGDAVAWLPQERILFAGDACVNGPYNFVGDGNIEQWVKTLDAALKLGARIVLPGHGSRGTGDLLADQQAYFQALRDQVGKLVSGKKSPAEIQRAVEQIKGSLSSDARVARYVQKEGFAGHVEKVMLEMTGQRFPATRPGVASRLHHARQHGLDLQV
jgi:cyclase